MAGVTDSKAVKGSKSMLDWTDASSSTSSIVVIVTGIAAGIVFTILLVCLFVTCRRKVCLFTNKLTETLDKSQQIQDFFLWFGEAQRARKYKKVEAKKLVKSNK